MYTHIDTSLVTCISSRRVAVASRPPVPVRARAADTSIAPNPRPQQAMATATATAPEVEAGHLPLILNTQNKAVDT